MEADITDRRDHLRIFWPIEARLDGIDIDRAASSADEHEIVSTFLRHVVTPHRAIGKDFEKRSEFAFYGWPIAVVNRQPLGNDSTLIQAPLDQFVILL